MSAASPHQVDAAQKNDYANRENPTAAVADRPAILR